MKNKLNQIPPMKDWQYNPFTSDKINSFKDKMKGSFTYDVLSSKIFWMLWLVFATFLVMSWVNAGNQWSKERELETLLATKKVNNKTEIQLAKDWKTMETKEIQPLIKQAKEIEVKINNLKAERTARIEARSEFLKNQDKCIDLKVAFVKKYNTPSTDEVCKELEGYKEKSSKYSLARAVAVAEGNGINETNPCNVRDNKTGKFRKYDTREDGIFACHNVFVNYIKYNPNVTILGAIHTFSPASDNNNPAKHTSNIIYLLAKKHNIEASFNTKLIDLIKL